MDKLRSLWLQAATHIIVPYVILSMIMGLYQHLSVTQWTVLVATVSFVVVALPHYLIWAKITAPKSVKVRASISIIDSRARTAIVFPFYVLGYFIVPIVLLFTGRDERRLPGVCQLLFGLREDLVPGKNFLTAYPTRLLQLLGNYQNNSDLGHLLGVILETDGSKVQCYGQNGKTDDYGLITQEGQALVYYSGEVNLFGWRMVGWGMRFGFQVDSAYKGTAVAEGSLLEPVVAIPVSLPLWVKLHKHPSPGTLLSIYCRYEDMWGSYADGKGGAVPQLITASSSECQARTRVVPLRGTTLRTYCEGFDLMAICADGEGGTYSAVREAHTSKCGAPSVAPTEAMHHPV